MSNCITDDLETCKDNGLEPKYFYLFVYNFPSFLMYLLIFMNVQISYM